MSAALAIHWLRGFNHALGRILSWLLVLTVAVLVIPVSLQIFSRFTAIIPHYIWTEELARFVFIWMIMLGAMLGIREASHFVIDIWPRLSPRAGAALDLLAATGVLILALVFLWWGIAFTRFAWWRTSELADLPLWWIHIAWPITGFVWLVFQGERVLRDLKILRGARA